MRLETCLLDSTTGPGYSSPGIMTVPNPRPLPRRSRLVRFVAALTVPVRIVVFMMAAAAVPSEPRPLAPHFESGGAQHYEHDEHNCLVCIVQHMVSVPPRVAKPVVEPAHAIRPTAVVTREVALARRWSPAAPRGPPVTL